METKKQDENNSEESKEVKPNVVEEAKLLAERLEKANAEAKELKAADILNGKADAGQAPEEPKEESPEDYSKKLLEGNVHPEA